MKRLIYFLGWIMLILMVSGASFWFYAEVIRGDEAWIAVEVTYLDKFYAYYYSPGAIDRIFDAGYNSCLADQEWNKKGKKDLEELRELRDHRR